MRIIYVPLYVPYNPKQISAHVLVIAATILLGFSFSTKKWSESHIHVPEGNQAVIGAEIRLRNGLRASSLRRCDVLRGKEVNCLNVDLVFQDCTPQDIFCSIAPSAKWCYGLLITAFVVCIIATGIGVVRPRAHCLTLGVAVLLVAVVQVLYASITHKAFTDGLVRQYRDMYEGFTYNFSNQLSQSFFMTTAANLCLLIAVGLSFQGYYGDIKREAKREQSGGGLAGAAGTGEDLVVLGLRGEPMQDENQTGDLGLISTLPATQSYPIPS